MNLTSWQDQVKQAKPARKHAPAPIDIEPEPTMMDPALLALLERIARATERTSRRVCVIELIMAVPVLFSVIGAGMMLWGFLYR